jgi:hypothetical protein
MGQEGFGHGQALGVGEGIAGPLAVAQKRRPRRLCRKPQEADDIGHQHLIALAHPIPFQHGEFRRMARPAFAVAPDMGKAEDPPLARCQQLFHRKFGTGVQIHPPGNPVIADGIHPHGMQVRLIAGADLQGRGVNLQKLPRGQPIPDGRLQTAPRQKRRAAVRVAAWVPPFMCHVGFHLAKPENLR